MANLDELVVTLTANTQGLQAELKSSAAATKSAMEKMEKSIAEFSKNSAANTSFFQTSMASMAGFVGGNLVLGAISNAKQALNFLGHEFIRGAEGAAEEELAIQKLANSLAMSGNYSAGAIAGLTEFADSMQNLTGIEDAAILTNLSFLSSLTKLDEQGLKRAQKAALDMSAALGMDLDTATKLVAKGIEGNVEAFGRYGLKIDEGRNKTENFNNVLGTLENRFGGAAAGAAKTFTGALNILGGAYDNLLESAGGVVTNNKVTIAMMTELTRIFTEMRNNVDGNAKVLKEEFGQALLTTTQVMGVTLVMIDNLIRGVTILSNAVQLASTPFAALKDTLTGFFKGEGFHPIDNALKNIKTDVDDIKNAANETTVFGKLAETVAHVGEAGSKAFGDMKTASDTVAPSVANNTQKVIELTAAQKAYNESIKGFAEGLAGQNAQIGQSYDFSLDLLKANKEAGAITEQEYLDQSLALNQGKLDAEQAALDEAYANKLISQETYNAARNELLQQEVLNDAKAKASQKQLDEANNKARAENMKSTLGTISTLQSANSKELVAIGKAAAIATATIDGYAAVGKALASAPPPFNFALAALVGVATAANISKIAGVGLASGITEVPKSASGGNLGDNFPAVLKPGERVVDSQTNQDLKAFLNNGGGGGANITLNVNIAPGTGISREQAANLVESLNDYITSGGLRLVTS